MPVICEKRFRGVLSSAEPASLCLAEDSFGVFSRRKPLRQNGIQTMNTHWTGDSRSPPVGSEVDGHLFATLVSGSPHRIGLTHSQSRSQVAMRPTAAASSPFFAAFFASVRGFCRRMLLSAVTAIC